MGVLFKSNCHILVPDLLCYAHGVSAVGNGNADVSMAELVRVKVLDTILLTEPMKVSARALRVDGFDVTGQRKHIIRMHGNKCSSQRYTAFPV